MNNLISGDLNLVMSLLYTNEIDREFFFNYPDSYLNLFKDLTDDEKTSLKALDKLKINNFSISLKSKLRGIILSTYFEELLICCKDVLHKLFDRFYINSKITNNESNFNYAVRFGEFIEYASTVESLSDVVYNLIRFINQKLRARHTNWPKFSIYSEPITIENIPCIAPHIQIETYDYDMDHVIDNINNLKNVSKKKQTYIMFSIENELTISRISDPLADFFSECNSITTLSSIIERLHKKYTPEITQELIHETIPILVNKNYLYLRSC